MLQQSMDFVLSQWLSFHNWNLAQNMLYVVICVSLLSALIISRFVGGSEFITVPASFVIFYFSALLANYGSAGIMMSETSDFQKTVYFSIIGHCIGGLLVLGVFKVRERGRV